MNVGKDSNTLMLHFNPRFDCHGDVNTIVCNSKEDGMWGEEDRKADFPFQHGDKIEVRARGVHWAQALSDQGHSFLMLPCACVAQKERAWKGERAQGRSQGSL